MPAVATPSRRRPPHGGCDEPPRLWGDERPATALRIGPEPSVSLPEAGTAIPASAAGARTLDDLVAGAWDGLVAAAPVACLVCAAPMAPRWSAGAGVVGGRCGGCGSTLE